MSRIPADLLPGGAYERFVAERAEAEEFSGTVLLSLKGRTVLARSYGMADRKREFANGPDTRFDLASITKMFTAVALLQLVQRRKVGLHERIGTYLKGFRTEVADITVHQLLTHTSGLGGSGTGDGQDANDVEQVWETAMARVREAPLEFEPGARFAYSNSGYLVLGAIVSEVAGSGTGQSYLDYVRRNIFETARMRRTGFYTRPEVSRASDIARRYATDPRTGERREVAPPYVGLPNHGAYATATDLVRFVHALTDGSLLGPGFADLIMNAKMALPATVKADLDRDSMFYGYGTFHTILHAERLYGHSGSGPGMANMLDHFPTLTGFRWS